MARPPALMAPPFATVWQTAQSPSAANCWPRAIVAAENTDASGRAIGAIDRHGSTAAATPIAAAQRAATVASAPRRLANGFCHLLLGAGGFGAANGTTLGAAACSPCNPLRIRSGVRGNLRNRTPVASKMALAMAAALGTEADSPTPSGGWSCRGSISTSIFGTSGNLMMG